MSNDYGYEHDAVCGRNGCDGTIESHTRDKDGCCSCHISPPCNYCTNPGFYCAECGWDANVEERMAQKAENFQKKIRKLDIKLRKFDDKIENLIRRIDSLKQGKVLGPIEPEYKVQYMNGYVMYYDKYNELVKYERRKLDNSKIDYHIKSHTHFSQICEGVYPEGTTREEVLKKVNGTFGGKFEHFGNGKFKFIAWTD